MPEDKLKNIYESILTKIPAPHDPRWAVLGLLLTYNLGGMFVLGFNRTPLQLGLVILGAITTDLVFARIVNKQKTFFPLSAIITALSIGILINYAHGLLYALFPIGLAIASKYIFRFQGRHVFNPSLAGLVACIFLSNAMISVAPAYQWNGTLAVGAFIATGAILLFILKINRWVLILSFWFFFILNLALRSYLTRHHVPPETLFLGAFSSPEAYLFSFFMITDPATSPAKKKHQILIGFAIAALDLYLHTLRTLNTLFIAAFLVQSSRFLLLHARSIFSDREQYIQNMKAGWRKLLFPLALLALLILGPRVIELQARPDSVDLKYVALDARHTNIQGRPSNILQLSDPAIARVAKWMLSVGEAVAVADANGDGLMDLFLTQPLKHADDRGNLYLNKGNFKFKKHTLPALQKINQNPTRAGLPSGALWFDYDNDGDPDLLVNIGYGKTRLLENRLNPEGRMRFVDKSNELGINDYTISLAANALDYNRDGKLDLIVANAIPPYLPGYDQPTQFNIFNLPKPEYEGDRRMLNVMHRTWHNASNGGENIFYENQGSRFKKLDINKLGLGGTRWTIDIATADFNQDGHTDLYMANDFGPDRLYIYKQDRFVSQRGPLTGDPGRDTYKGMNASAGDFDGNGTMDVYVSNVHERLQAEGSLLWLNDGSIDKKGYRSFKDHAATRNALNEHRFGWGATVGDINLDGRLDILQANGHLDDAYDKKYDTCPDYWYWNDKIALTDPDIHGYADAWADLRGACIYPYERDRIYLNQGRYFVDIAEQAGLTAKIPSRGMALADLDNDGDLDLIVVHQFAPPVVYRLDMPAQNWLGLRLIGNGSTCNRDALGSRVSVQALINNKKNQLNATQPDDPVQVREVQASNGFATQNEPRLLFGIPDAEGKARVSINWCGDAKAQHYDLSMLRYHTIHQEQINAD